MTTFASAEHLRAAVGRHLGFGDWHAVTQDDVNSFADVTGDHQWIHVDVARAADGPFRTTIAHGYFTLSLIPLLTRSIYSFENTKLGVNYGSNRVRFPAPVPVGSNVRAGATVIDVTEGPNGVQVVVLVEVECDQSQRPVCVAETVALLVF